METVEDLLKSLKSMMYERFTSPIAIIFLLSWCAYNWQLIYYLFTVSSDISTENRISYIKKTYIDVQLNFIKPLISAVIMSIAYPLISYLSHWIKEFTNSRKRKSREYFIYDKLLTFDQSRQLSEQIFELQKINEQILRERTDSENRLIEEKNELESERITALEDLDIQNIKFKEDQIKLKNDTYEMKKTIEDNNRNHKRELKQMSGKFLNEKSTLKQELEDKDKNLKRFVEYSGKAISGFGKIMAILEKHAPSRVRLGGDKVTVPMIDYGKYELIVKLIDESIPPNIYFH